MENLTPPLPPETPNRSPEEKQWSVILHVSPLVGLLVPGFGNVLAPLIIWLVKKTDLPALDADGKNVLNAQISWSIWMLATSLVGGLAACLLVIPILLPIGFYIAWLVFTILDAIKTSNGEPYNYPLTIKFLQ